MGAMSVLAMDAVLHIAVAAPVFVDPLVNLPTTQPLLAQAPVVTAVPLESGWTQYEVAEDGFAIALPPHWQQIEVNPDVFGEAIATVNEQLGMESQQFSDEMLSNLAAQGIKLYGLDIAPEAIEIGLPSSINVLKLDLGVAYPLDTFVELGLTQARALALPGTPVTDQRLMLANGLEAAEINYTMQLPGITGDLVDVALTQYAVMEGTSAYLVTLGAPLALADSYESTFTEIGSSFQLLD